MGEPPWHAGPTTQSAQVQEGRGPGRAVDQDVARFPMGKVPDGQQVGVTVPLHPVADKQHVRSLSCKAMEAAASRAARAAGPLLQLQVGEGCRCV